MQISLSICKFYDNSHYDVCSHYNVMIEPIRSRYRSWMSKVFMLSIICIDVLSLNYMQDLYLQPRSAIIRINHRLDYFYLFLSYFFQSWRLMIASVGKRAPVFLPSRAEIARCSRERNYSRMTRLFTIHINRVDRRRSGGEKSGYTWGGPLHLACNAYVVTAMCHNRRAGAARSKARVMNIYPRLLQNKCQYRGTRGERATKRNEESRNPGLRLRFSPELL